MNRNEIEKKRNIHKKANICFRKIIINQRFIHQYIPTNEKKWNATHSDTLTSTIRFDRALSFVFCLLNCSPNQWNRIRTVCSLMVTILYDFEFREHCCFGIYGLSTPSTNHETIIITLRVFHRFLAPFQLFHVFGMLMFGENGMRCPRNHKFIKNACIAVNCQTSSYKV